MRQYCASTLDLNRIGQIAGGVCKTGDGESGDKFVVISFT